MLLKITLGLSQTVTNFRRWWRGIAAPLIRGASERWQSEAIADAKEQGRAG
jgi:hypothetical protein